MTNGQIEQLQELIKCYGVKPWDYDWVQTAVKYADKSWIFYTDDPLTKREKAMLRRLAHQYRHQIKAMKRNRK